MMGRTHALSGLVVGVAAGQFVWHLNPAHLAVAAVVTAGAAVLPDIDHPDATCAREFGFVTKAFAWVIEHISGGHRHGTHSLVGVAAFTGAAYAAEHYRHTLGGKIGLGLLLVLVLAAALRALKIGGHFADLLGPGDGLSSGTGQRADDIVRAAEAKLAAIGEQIRELAQLQCRLRRLVQVCERGNSDDCVTLHLREMVSGITVEGAAP